MNICLPFTTLEPVMDKLNTKYWFSTMKEKDSKSYEETISNIIDNALIPMKAVLGTSTISVKDFVNLQLGDIIKVDKKVSQELEVYVGNIKKFKALPGYSDNKYAVRVTEVIREESE
jgi:flagellar motor switch protein FliM